MAPEEKIKFAWQWMGGTGIAKNECSAGIKAKAKAPEAISLS